MRVGVNQGSKDMEEILTAFDIPGKTRKEIMASLLTSEAKMTNKFQSGSADYVSLAIYAEEQQ